MYTQTQSICKRCVQLFSIFVHESIYIDRYVRELSFSHTKMWCSWTDVGLFGVREGNLEFLQWKQAAIKVLLQMMPNKWLGFVH